MKNVLVQKSQRGDIALFDARDDFMASFKNGKWIDDSVFQPMELEDFTIIEDDDEVSRILEQARSMLGQPYAESKQTKSA